MSALCKSLMFMLTIKTSMKITLNTMSSCKLTCENICSLICPCLARTEVTVQTFVIQSLNVLERTTSSVSLNWTKSEGNSFLYRVECSDGYNMNTNDTYVIITGLTPGVQYTFTVFAVAGDKVTERQGTNVSFYTSK